MKPAPAWTDLRSPLGVVADRYRSLFRLHRFHGRSEERSRRDSSCGLTAREELVLQLFGALVVGIFLLLARTTMVCSVCPLSRPFSRIYGLVVVGRRSAAKQQVTADHGVVQMTLPKLQSLWRILRVGRPSASASWRWRSNFRHGPRATGKLRQSRREIR